MAATAALVWILFSRITPTPILTPAMPSGGTPSTPAPHPPPWRTRQKLRAHAAEHVHGGGAEEVVGAEAAVGAALRGRRGSRGKGRVEGVGGVQQQRLVSWECRTHSERQTAQPPPHRQKNKHSHRRFTVLLDTASCALPPHRGRRLPLVERPDGGQVVRGAARLLGKPRPHLLRLAPRLGGGGKHPGVAAGGSGRPGEARGDG